MARSTSPGPVKPSNAVATTENKVKTKRNLFLFPEKSAAAPNTGEMTATISIEIPRLMPQSASPDGSPSQITFLKYSGKANVTIMTLNDVFAKSNSNHEASFNRPSPVDRLPNANLPNLFFEVPFLFTIFRWFSTLS